MSLRSVVAASVVAFLLLVSLTVAAQLRPTPPPALMVKRTDRSEPLRLQELKAEVRIVGHLAETRLTMTFFNPHDRALAGDLYVPLPEGATVSGYGLDVNGVLVDGVVVDKEEARRAFEQEVRRGVDPGLVEWVGGSNFKTRVFPIPAHGTRTVMVRYVAEVEEGDDGARFRLPLAYRQPVGSLALRIEVVKPDQAPTVVAGGPKGLRFEGWRDSYVAEASLKDATLDQDLVVALPALDERPVRVETAEDGNIYFTIRERLTVPIGETFEPPRTVRLLWDASASREGADHAREVGLVRRWLASLGAGPVAVDLVLFRNVAAPARRFEIPRQLDDLVRALEAVPYDGGTQMAAIAPAAGEAEADLCLLVTDGVSNVGAADPGELRAPVYVLNAATTANHAFLRDIALRSGGVYLNLQRVTDDQALAAIGTRPFSFLGAHIEGRDDAELYPRRPRPVLGVLTLAGRLPDAEATVILEYGLGGHVTHRSTFTVRAADASEGEMLRRDWAQKKVDDLLVFPEENAAALSAVGKAHGVVTPNTSLIVLERLEQYVEHRIRPPAGLPQMREAYDTQVAALDAQKKVEQTSKLEHVLALWKARVEWWETKFEYPAGFRYGAPAGDKTGVAEESGMGAVTATAEMHAPSPRPASMAREIAADDEAPGRAKKKADGKGEERPEPEPAIVISAWKPDTPYLAALNAAAAEARFAVYMVQRKQYGTAPSFFLDCADFFREKGDDALAIQLLTNIAELQLEEPALLRILAHRLAQLDRLDESIRQFERVLRLRPEEPQSYRDLALVYARRAVATAGDAPSREALAKARADYRRALELLAKVVMERWDRFDEIEVMALMELNNLWPRAKAVGLEEAPVDERLLQHLDLDIRIVMTWDADMTDMDLHVFEPSQEEAYYGHNRTTIGGLVSRDFTQGYGPEEYLVRKAMRGTYVVRTKFFGSSAAQLQGAVTLQVDVFTNYGRPNEKRRSLTFRLTENKEMFTVGEIEF